jgi:hypothetical protein
MSVFPVTGAVAVGLAVAATAGWAGLLALLMAATRTPGVPTGPPTGVFPPESPAVVDLITGGWRLCDEAAAATLLDLAARRMLAIEEIGPELSLVRLPRNPPAQPLTRYEQMVLDHVAGLSRDRVVATAALAEGARHLGSWWKRFSRAVIDEARAAGLSQPRWRTGHRLVLHGAAVVPAALAAMALLALLPADTYEDVDGWIGAFVVAAGATFVLLSRLVEKLGGERGTPAGAAAAARWLGVREHLRTGRFGDQPAAAVTIWGRPLAYAAALGLAERAVGSLPVSRPADDQRAWSDYGGMWHPMLVRYRGPGPWGRLFWARRGWPAAGFALAAGLFTGFWLWVIGLVGSVVGWPAGLATPLAVLGALAVGGPPLVGALADLTHRTTVEGQVVRLRRHARKANGSDVTHWLALDDGRVRVVHAYGVDGSVWAGLVEGDLVRALVGRWWGWAYEVQVLRPSRHRTGGRDDDATGHPRPAAAGGPGAAPPPRPRRRAGRWRATPGPAQSR